MMKRVFISLLVLTMASVAYATHQISVNGDRDPVDSEYVILPSQELILDIWTDSIIPTGTGSYWALVVNSSLAQIDPASGVAVAGDPGFYIERGVGVYDMFPGFPPGLNGLCGVAFDSVPPDTLAGTTLFDLIVFHCEAPGDAILHLYESPDGTIMNLSDTVIVHQIPEPMTIGLLGLGALFLRRRK